MPTMMIADDPLQTFSAWSASHWAAIAAAIIASAALALARRRQRRAPLTARRLDRAFAAFAAVTWLVTQVLQASLDEFPAGTALPLHVSDLTALVVPLALWTGWRWTRAVLYYWGLALASLAFLLPDLRHGPARLGYWLFWLPHVVIITAVVYDLVGRGFRPGWRDFYRAACASLLYAALVTPFNAVTGYSYGYLGPERQGEPSVLSGFGPWPWRVAPIVASGLAGMAVLTVPWELSERRIRQRRRRQKRRGHTS
jgi:hypothetical integral membrane protein (TIGR02206 family)